MDTFVIASCDWAHHEVGMSDLPQEPCQLGDLILLVIDFLSLLISISRGTPPNNFSSQTRWLAVKRPTLFLYVFIIFAVNTKKLLLTLLFSICRETVEGSLTSQLAKKAWTCRTIFSSDVSCITFLLVSSCCTIAQVLFNVDRGCIIKIELWILS